ncbi:putative ankyrin repeat protein RF_0381 [Schistocerca gregaria]|uniref:putative ankyrin repeat protein RF_0381 n=1 Tax=Schistocerca gregaria TaxID=7010 RepID=UPI00211E5B91|nr:putative ankyrin repeat protein RF_0381 [Schistocerca gregaria]
MTFFKLRKSKHKGKKEKSSADIICKFCEQKDPAGLINYLNKTKASVNVCDKYGRYPIHIAAKSAMIELVDILLKAGSWKNVAEENTRRWNVLHYAIASRSLEMVYKVVCFSDLISNYRGLITHQDAVMADQNTPLHYYCSSFRDNYKNCVGLIINSGTDVNSQNICLACVLNAASRLGSLEIVQLLLDNNAKPNISNKQGETAIHFAARSDSLEIIKLLLNYGAKKMVRGQYGYPVDVAVSPSAKKMLSIDFTPSESLATTNSCQLPLSSGVHVIKKEEICMGPKVSMGGFSDLYKCVWRGIDVAVKKSRLSSDGDPVQFFAEVEIMSKLRHNNILLIFGAYFNPPDICLVTEFMKGGSLYDYLRKKKTSI